MSAELEFDLRSFNANLEACAEESSKTFPDFVNGQALAVAIAAIKHTVKANADSIAWMLGQIATGFSRSKKTGKITKRRIIRTDTASFAARIINARRKKIGRPMIWGDELDAQAKKLIAARVRSVGFIKSGWIEAIKKLSAAVGYKANADTSERRKGQPKGDAIPAQGGLAALTGDISATIINSALIAAGKYGQHGDPMPMAEAGLQAGLNEVSADMLSHLAEKLNPVFDKYSAK